MPAGLTAPPDVIKTHNASLASLIDLVRGRDPKRRFDPVWTDQTNTYYRALKRICQGA